MIKIKYDHIKAASYALADDETRYYLEGIHIKSEETELMIEATDGFRLIRITEAYGDIETIDAIISRDTVDMILELFEHESEINFDFKNKKIILGEGDQYPLNLIDATYPNTDKAFKTAKFPEKVNNGFLFNLEYFSDFARSLKAFRGSPESAMVSFGEPDTPIKVEVGNDNAKYVGMLMPVRST